MRYFDIMTDKRRGTRMHKPHTTFREYMERSSLTEEEKREIKHSVEQIRPIDRMELGIERIKTNS